MELFESVTSLVTLEAAWEKVKENAGAAGGDGMTVEDFDSAAAANLLALQSALRRRRYRPGPNRQVLILKRSGGTRPLTIPTVTDRVAQTAAALILTPLLDPEMESSSFGYRPGRSVQQAVARIEALRNAGYAWVIDADIERYFEMVPHDRLMTLLDGFIDDPLLTDLIALWLEHAGDHGRGLPQGSPLSPLLSNLYLDSFDESFAEGGVRLVRFADDFVLLCRSREGAERTLPRVSERLRDRGLRLNAEKTRIVSFEEGFRFLGHLFLRSLTLRSPEGEPPDLATRLMREIARDDAAQARTEADEAAQEAAGWRSDLRVLYVHGGKRRLALRNQSFTVLEDGRELIALPPERIDRIDLGPSADAEPEALRQARNVMVQFLDADGATLGLLTRPEARRAGLHMQQARRFLDPDARVALARVLVAGRIHNQRAQLRRLNRSAKDPEVTAMLPQMTRLHRMPRKPSLDVAGLLGVEGQAAALYWRCLARLLRHGWTLTKRVRRPATDPVNAVLSMTAAMLTRDVQALVARAGLHPGFGILHGTADGHMGCVFDLVEEFRAPLAEATTIYLFNNRLLTRDHFTAPDPARRAVRLTKDGRQVVIRQYEEALARPLRSPWSGQRIGWRRLMEEQVAAYGRVFRDGADYVPYKMDY